MKKTFLLFLSFFILSCSSIVPDSDAKKAVKKKASIQKILKKTRMKLTSSAFTHNGAIPSEYTCDGEDISPPLSWTDVPAGTKSFVLIHDDPDAVPVAGFVWDHWILINIPAETKETLENKKTGIEMRNSFQKTSYGGPCPPRGEHRYFFKLYALNTMLDLPGKSSKADIEKAMEGHILAKAEMIGTYDRGKK